jgi:hypothetical protein
MRIQVGGGAGKLSAGISFSAAADQDFAGGGKKIGG